MSRKWRALSELTILNLADVANREHTFIEAVIKFPGRKVRTRSICIVCAILNTFIIALVNTFIVTRHRLPSSEGSFFTCSFASSFKILLSGTEWLYSALIPLNIKVPHSRKRIPIWTLKFNWVRSVLLEGFTLFVKQDTNKWVCRHFWHFNPRNDDEPLQHSRDSAASLSNAKRSYCIQLIGRAESVTRHSRNTENSERFVFIPLHCDIAARRAPFFWRKRFA